MTELRRLVVTGAAGMLGRAVVQACDEDVEVLPLTRRDCDLADAPRVREWIGSRAPQIVVHCAAWTDVDGCERDPARAERANAEATRHVAEAAQQVGAALCYVSTDYVFDGRKNGAYDEDDAPAPLNVYGRTKRQGEEHVLRLLSNSWVVRSSWLFGLGGRNFVRTMIAVLRERDEVQVVNDQIGSPTYVVDLAEALCTLVKRGRYGIYHVTNDGSCSWHELATTIGSALGSRTRVLPCASDAFPRPAARPRNSVLANRRYDAAGLGARRHWRDALRDYLTCEPEAAR